MSQVLTEQAISAIDLKLEGAEYKASPLGCTSSTTRHTRSPIAFCKLHFLFQKTNVEQSISLADIEDFSVVRRERFSFKELVLGPNPLYLIPDDVNEINFYWGYRPDDDVLIKLNNFIKATTVSFETVELKNIDLRFHFAKKFSDTTSLSEFANAIKQLGFLNMKLTYYTQQMQLSRLEVKNGIATISLLSVTQDEVLATQKFRAVSNNVKLTTLKSFDKEAYRARLRRINSEVLRKLGSGIRTGIRNGAQYEIGATIIFFIGEAINNPGTNEPVILPGENKTALKELAYFVAEEIGQQRGADARQINLTTSVAAQCIDRGECSTEEHVIRDVADSLHRLRPDLMIGNEYAWNKTKAFFENIGSYLSGKFDEIKAFFTEQANRTLPTHSSYWQPPGHLFPILPQSRIQKRSLYKWYESVWLMYLIKNIETVFRYFDFELQQDEEVSEAKIAEYLAKIWQALARCQINNNATEEFTLNVLKKLNTSIFRDDFFNISQPCSIEMESMIPTVLLPTSRSINRISQRNKRQVTAVPLETDFLES